MEKGNDSSRMAYLDVLRVLAAFSVVMLHSAAQFWYTLDIRSMEWVIANSYNAAFRFGVPVFVMISGALFLNPGYKVDVKRLYKHNILRLLVISLVWSAAYGLLDCVLWFDIGKLSVKDILREMLAGRYHLWFLPMLLGIYVLLPILKIWLEHAKKRDVEYFLLLFLIIQVGGETVRALTRTDEIHIALDVLKVDMVCGYMGYFVWGYYLVHVRNGDKWRKWICAGLVPAVLLNMVLGCLFAQRDGRATALIYDSFGVFTFVIATAIFLLCKNNGTKISKRAGTVLHKVSVATLGVYLMHVGLMEITEKLGFHSMFVPNIIGIPLYAMVCFLVCLLLSMVLRKIPFIGKYIC